MAGPTLNLARILPRQEAVDSSDNPYRPIKLMASYGPTPPRSLRRAARAALLSLEAELLHGCGSPLQRDSDPDFFVTPHILSNNEDQLIIRSNDRSVAHNAGFVELTPAKH